MKLGDFKKIAQEQATVGSSRRSGRDAPSTYSTEALAELEKKFWRNILFNPPMYGADCPVPKGLPLPPLPRSPTLSPRAPRRAMPPCSAPCLSACYLLSLFFLARSRSMWCIPASEGGQPVRGWDRGGANAFFSWIEWVDQEEGRRVPR